MHLIQEEIGIPKIKIDKKDDNNAIFVVGPLPSGYGVTLGNSLRRVLLSSLPGAAISSMKIKGVSHEYSTIKGVKDSVLDITLNLKQLFLKKESKEPTTITLSASKPGVVTAKDIKATNDVEVLNPDLYITTLDAGGKLEIELLIEKGVGYVPASQKKTEEANLILLDSVFSPVRKVKFDIENMRVGQMTNLDKLTLEIETDGSITPEDALKFSSNILQSYFKLFNEDNIQIESDFMSDLQKIVEKEQEKEIIKPKQVAYTPIEILGFSPRTLNALINGGIGSIEELCQCTKSKLCNLRGFGQKALTEVEKALTERGLSLVEE